MITRGDFESSYQAVMYGMLGSELTDVIECSYDWACEGALEALKAMSILESMKYDDAAYITVGTMVGYVSHSTSEDAIAWAQGTHPSQKAHAFKVERNKTGWQITDLPL